MSMKRAQDRWMEYTLVNVEKPKVMYEYYVTGRGQFAWDMLRYDACWPADSAAAAMLADSITDGGRGMRSIKMRSYRPPTIERWTSFLWSVGNHEI